MRTTSALPEINEDDIRKAVSHPDAEFRMAATVKICRAVRSRRLAPSERKLAYAILKPISQDVADIVRRALAVTLKNSPNLPKPIAIALIADIDSIAAPILQFSPVLTHSDLVDVLRSKAAAKITAIAKRASIEGDVVDAIVHFGDTTAISALAANDSASFTDAELVKIAETYHDDDLIRSAMLSRRDLPVHIVEKLVSKVSEDVAVNIVRRHAVSVDVAVDLAERTRERATLDLVDNQWRLSDLFGLCEHLRREGRLTPTFILRAAGMGKIHMLEHALATRAGLSYSRASLMVHDAGPLGLRSLCAQADVPAYMVDFIAAAVRVFHDMESNAAVYSQSAFQRTMLERILTLPQKIGVQDQDYFLDRLDALGLDAAA